MKNIALVLDASGEPKSGFFYGNNFWIGSKSQCLDLGNTKPFQLDPDILKNNSKYRNINEEFPPYHLNYFVAFFYHNSTLQYQFRFKYDVRARLLIKYQVNYVTLNLFRI